MLEYIVGRRTIVGNVIEQNSILGRVAEAAVRKNIALAAKSIFAALASFRLVLRRIIAREGARGSDRGAAEETVAMGAIAPNEAVDSAIGGAGLKNIAVDVVVADVEVVAEIARHAILDDVVIAGLLLNPNSMHPSTVAFGVTMADDVSLDVHPGITLDLEMVIGIGGYKPRRAILDSCKAGPAQLVRINRSVLHLAVQDIDDSGMDDLDRPRATIR